MTLLFVDGFDHYATADLTKKYTSTVGAGVAIDAAAGRRASTGALAITGNNGGVVKNVTAGASFVIGFAFKVVTLGATNLVVLYDAGTIQCSVALNVDGTLSVTRNGTALTSGTSTFSISVATWYYLEFKVTIANSISASSCKVRVNGVDWITVATSQDLQNTANASANQFALLQNGSTVDPTFDDLYVCNQSGSTNNDFLGDCRVDALFPTSDGNYTAWTPSTGTDHYALVDETAPNTSDYNSGASVGDRDSYGFGNLAALTSQTVYGVQVNAALLKDDAGSKSAATFARSVSTNTDGTGTALGTSQVYVSQVFEQDPNAAAAWTESTVNAAEFGVIVTA